MTSLSNPHKPMTYRWWIHEAAICEQDGHPDAARAAYRQAADAAGDDWERDLAIELGEGL